MSGLSDTYNPNKVTNLVPEDMLLEVLLVFGYPSENKDIDYWHAIWEYLNERYPMLFASGEFPDDWTYDPNHERDMGILTYIHTWQRTRLWEDRSGHT